MFVKIIKEYKCMKVGDTPNVSDTYGKILIDKKVAEKFTPKVEKK